MHIYLSNSLMHYITVCHLVKRMRMIMEEKRKKTTGDTRI